MCVYVRGPRWCGRRRHLGAQCRAPAPAQSIGSLSPPPRLGCRQVHFRATGQIDSSAFIFFRRRSGSCLEAGGRSSEMVRDRHRREGGRESGIESDEGGRHQEKEVLLAFFLIHVSFHFSSSSLFSLSLSVTLQHNQHIPPLKLLSRRALTTPPSPKLEISPRTS